LSSVEKFHDIPPNEQERRAISSRAPSSKLMFRTLARRRHQRCR
jgi:hypothetical protein